LNNQHITEEIKKEIKICTEMNENENTTTQKPMEHCESSAKGKLHSNTGLPPEERKKNQINNCAYFDFFFDFFCDVLVIQKCVV